MKKLVGTCLILIFVTSFFGQNSIEQKFKSANQYHNQQIKQPSNQKVSNTQIITYSVGSIPYAPYSYTTGTAVLPKPDDYWLDTMYIGFNFNYFGKVYNKFIIGVNGQCTFDLSKRYQNDNWSINFTIPNTIDLPGNTICAAFRDIDPTTSGDIYFSSLGVSPNRYAIVSWTNIPLFSNPGSCTGKANSTFQMVLYETTNCIDIYIKNSTSCPGWNSGYGIVGIQDSAAVIGYSPLNRNFPNAWTATNEAWRFIPAGSPCGFPTNMNEMNPTNSINIYPNPTNGIFIVKNNLLEGNSLEIFNLLGQKIIEQKINNSKTQIDLSNFNNGMYWVKLISKEKEIIYQTKIVKE